jgi:NitT/TauT family transport system substrate-binding protein
VKEVKNFWVTMQKSEFVKSQQDITAYIDTAVYKAALDGVAKENPKDPYWKNLQKVYEKRNT